MSKYTTEVRFICESLTGHDDSTGYDDIDSIIEDEVLSNGLNGLQSSL